MRRFTSLSACVLAAVALSAGCATSEPGTDNAAHDKATSSKTAAAPTKPAGGNPKQQNDFVAVVIDTREQADGVDNKVKLVGIKRKRNNALCDVLHELTIKNWVGRVHEVSANSDGLGILELEIGDDVKLGTWNNALSDLDDHTLIKESAQPYGLLEQLEEDDKVIFSGKFVREKSTCIKEKSITLNGTINSPDYLFKFTKVKKA